MGLITNKSNRSKRKRGSEIPGAQEATEIIPPTERESAERMAPTTTTHSSTILAESPVQASSPIADEWLIGGTFSPLKGYAKMIQDAKEAKATYLQFFISKSDQWPARYVSKEEKEEFELALKSEGWKKENIVVHGHLHLNLASKNEVTYERCFRLFESEVKACSVLGISLYVLHPGSPKKVVSHDEAIVQTAEAVKAVATRFPSVKILFENMAGQGDVIGSTLEEIGELVRKADDLAGVCLDTQHLWAAGYDVTQWESLLEKFDKTIGLQHLQLIHLNNSSVPFNSKKDSHARIGNGLIPLEKFKQIIQCEKLKSTAFILETIHSEHPDCVIVNREEIELLSQMRAEKEIPNSILWQQDTELLELDKRIRKISLETTHNNECCTEGYNETQMDSVNEEEVESVVEATYQITSPAGISNTLL